MNEKKHLPIYGVGPVYVITVIIITVIGLILTAKGYLSNGKITHLKVPFIILGCIIIIISVTGWVIGAFKSNLDNSIKENHLITDGIYAYMRNPMYSNSTFICVGTLLIAHNLWLLILPFVYWIFLTVLMKNTEEKWLFVLYGDEYKQYCKKVNRFIPWFKR